jgi:integrase/recombinase XerD
VSEEWSEEARRRAESFDAAATAAIATRLSSKTRESYQRAVIAWVRHCLVADCDPCDPRLEVAAGFRDELLGGRYKARDGTMRAYSTSTVRDYLAALSFVYRRLVAQRPAKATWNPFDPEALAWPPASRIGLTEEMDAAAAERMVAAATGAGALRDAALIHLLFATGARRMSIVSARRETVRRSEDGLVLRVKTKGSGGAAFEELVVPEDAAKSLEAWLEVAPKSVWVFPGRGGKKHLDLCMANIIVARWGEAVSAVHATPHRFRVGFITAAFSAGLPWRDIQASVHHADPRSTQRYDRGRRGGNVANELEKKRKETKKGLI